MKTLARLHRAWRWWRLGCTARKAWLLAAPTEKKPSYTPELLVITALALAYTFVAWNDTNTASTAYTSAMVQKNKAELALVDMLSGKAMLIDQKTWTQCYVSTTM